MSQSDIHRDSLFPRDNTTTNTYSNTGNDTTLSDDGVISPEQVIRCQIYDMSQSTAHNNHFINPSHQMHQRANTMVAPTHIVTIESLILSNMSAFQSQDGVRPKLINSSHTTSLSNHSNHNFSYLVLIARFLSQIHRIRQGRADRQETSQLLARQ